MEGHDTLTLSTPPMSSPDPGLRKLLTWTFVALVVAVLMAVLGAGLAIRIFDNP